MYVDYLDGVGPILAGEFSSLFISRSLGQISGTPDETIGSVVQLRNASGSGLIATCLGDANADSVIGFADLNLVLANFGVSDGSAFAYGDVNNDGFVDFADLNILLARFGQSCN